MGSTSGKKRKPNNLKDYVSWFEIPAHNFEQALDFYNHIYGIQMETTSSNSHRMAFFPANGGIGGAVVSGPGSNPNDSGPLVYLNGGDDLNNVLNKVEEAGGRVVMTKTLTNKEGGYFAIFIDSEGNKLAIHSKN
ncbi:MAG: putative enzyme related to lactoylglutathione lyase [Bacteroidia bacterium]|jgi:predicted enzyme related to lactoylglutathione lyase